MDGYKVLPNYCGCHPETCCCNPWIVVRPNGERHSTFWDKSTAQEVADALNAAKVNGKRHGH